MKRQKNASLRFYPNVRKANKKSERVPIYLKLTFNGAKAETRIPAIYDVKSDDLKLWNDNFMRMTGKYPNLNSYLNKLQSKWDQYSLENNFTPLTSLENIVAIITERKSEAALTTVFCFVDEYMTTQIELRNDITEGTKKNYRKAVKHFKAFLKQEKLIGLLLTEFKYTHAKGFRLYMGSADVNNSAVSASSNIRRIKTIFSEAIRMERIAKNPFSDIKLVQKSAINTPSLTINQVKQILDCRAIQEDSNLQFYKDLFLFGCFTGLSCIDYRNLQVSDLFPVFDKRLKLDTSRTKTSKPVIQVIAKPAQAIIEKYAGLTYKQKGLLFPKISMETINEKLKIIAALAGININLSTKISRTTCNQIIINTGNWDPVYKRAFLGWSNRSDIQSVYTTIEDQVLLKNTQNLESYLISNLGTDLLQKI